MLKRCSRCKEEKNTSEFRRDRTKPDGLSYSCKTCRRTYDASKYTQKYGEQAKTRNNQRAADTLAKLLEYKLDNPCIKCGEDDPACLDFHHLDPNEKDFAIGSRRTGSWDKMVLELAKCAVLCANCHRKFHAGRFELPEQCSDA